jgi:hypothetical protein
MLTASVCVWPGDELMMIRLNHACDPFKRIMHALIRRARNKQDLLRGGTGLELLVSRSMALVVGAVVGQVIRMAASGQASPCVRACAASPAGHGPSIWRELRRQRGRPSYSYRYSEATTGRPLRWSRRAASGCQDGGSSLSHLTPVWPPDTMAANQPGTQLAAGHHACLSGRAWLGRHMRPVHRMRSGREQFT